MKVAVLWVPWCFIKYTISDISRKTGNPVCMLLYGMEKKWKRNVILKPHQGEQQ